MGSRIMLCLIAAWLLAVVCACSPDSDNAASGSADVTTLKVAVLVEGSKQARWERTAAWALENIRQAQAGMNRRVELQLTFKNQDDDDVQSYARQIADDPSVVAVVGPTTTPKAESVAGILGEGVPGPKPMIATTATGIEYQRRNASKPYIWNLAESDVAQIEIIISEIAARQFYSSIPVMLMARDEDEADSHNAYMEWFAFIAEEYGLKVDGIYLYKTEDDVRQFVRGLCGTDSHLSYKALLFNPSSPEIAIAFDDEIGRMRSELPAGRFLYIPKLFCSDAFVDERVLEACRHADYEGVDLYASPESGFHIAYRQRFGEELINGEAQFYDALCLVAYAAVLSEYTGESINDAILAVVDGRDGKGGTWLPADMGTNFRALAQGTTPDIDGVSSPWTFDENTHSSVVGSTFRHWRMSDNRLFTVQYVSTEGSKRTSSSKNFWEWTAGQTQRFDADEGSGLVYPAADKRWALLIAGSTGWANYRFQADVFAMYQILRRHGYDDDHIVLIAEDDVANHPNNPQPATLRVSENGDNLYVPAAIDYHPSRLQPDDIGNILQGKASERLPHVINADDDDNIFIFWSGHGSVGSLDFGGNSYVSYWQMRNYLSSAPRRKLLFAVEACYSGGLGEYCTGLPGVLFITAARPYETSHADVWSETAGVYLSNGFTRGFQDAIGRNPAISLRDLYYTLAQHTAGSHVTIYNVANYGSVYNNTMEDFLE